MVKCMQGSVRGFGERNYLCEKLKRFRRSQWASLVMLVIVYLRTGVARKIKIDVICIVSDDGCEALPRREVN